MAQITSFDEQIRAAMRDALAKIANEEAEKAEKRVRERVGEAIDAVSRRIKYQMTRDEMRDQYRAEIVFNGRDIANAGLRR